MRTLRNLIGILMIGVFISCKKEPNIVITTPPVIDTSAMIKYTGVFQNGPYGSVMGKAEILKQGNDYVLKLRNFSSSGGPDLHVYLSKETHPVNFIDLGTLRQTTGDQAYSIPGSPDFSLYKYAMIHCQAYDHLFGRAAIQ